MTDSIRVAQPIRLQEKVGLKINIDKTKFLRYNPGRLDPLTIRERDVEDAESRCRASDIRAQEQPLTGLTNYGKVASSVEIQRSLSSKPM